MCTLSWLPSVDGFTLHMNRDERLSRVTGDPPEIWRVGAVQFIAPKDQLGGGTWIGVNDWGLAVAVANRYPNPAPVPPTGPISRGQLVTTALACPDTNAVDEWLETIDCTDYQPFHLVVCGPEGPPHGTLWDGSVRTDVVHSEPGLVATSSSRDQEGAERSRRALFETATRAEGGLTDARLLELHRSRDPEPGPLAISMERSDAATVSMNTVRVTGAEVSFTYTPGPPHRTAPLEPLVLQRA
ncbi:MAG: NRDE family protein [Longimicrobiales bacterium]